MKRVLNIAHRGFSGKYPENTNIAFVKALTEGYCDGIELDVHMTKDGQLVIIHDERLDRTTTGTGLISDYTFEEVTQFDAGIKYHPKFKGQKIVPIDRVLDMVKKHNVRLNIEIKHGSTHYEGIEQKIINKVAAYSLQNKVLLASFDKESIKTCKTIAPHMEVGFLCEKVPEDIAHYIEDFIFDYLNINYENVTKEVVDIAHSKGKKIIVWTVDKAEDMKAMIDMGVDAIITNYPDVLNDIINGLC